jgi:hypothetical protein
MTSSESLGFASSPKQSRLGQLISVDMPGLAAIKEFFIKEPFSHAMESNKLPSKGFRCRFNSL